MASTNATQPIEFDQARAEQFADKIVGVLDNGALCIMLAIGHRTGLLDQMAKMSPASSAKIAAAAELSERYVREWLAAMVTGGIVEYNPTDASYYLPPEHAESITRDASLGNLAIYSQFIAMLGGVQEHILDSFESGEGTRYDDYPCFHQIMAEDSNLTVVSGLFDDILPLVEGMEQRLEQGIDVMDAGCGRGMALTALAKRYPNSRFTGYDLCDDAIAFAQSHARKNNLTNLHFEVRDLSDFNEVEHFDFITSFDAVHDQRNPQQLISSYQRALRSGGCYLMQDIGGSAYLENNMDFPLATLLYTISCHHCMPVSLGQGGEGLGTMWGWETAQEMLYRAGFNEVLKHTLPHDPTNVWFVSKKQ